MDLNQVCIPRSCPLSPATLTALRDIHSFRVRPQIPHARDGPSGLQCTLQVSRFRGLNELLTDILPRHVAEVLLSKKMQEQQRSQIWNGLQRLSHARDSAASDIGHTRQV